MVLGFTILIEGVLPFFLPELYKKYALEVSRIEPEVLRIIGFLAIILGLIILYFAKGML